MADFPPGVTHFTATIEAFSPTQKPLGGQFFVEIETPLVWAATGREIVKVSDWVWLTNGVGQMELPYTDQNGFTAGLGGAPVINWGYLFYLKPIRSQLISSQTYVHVPASLGPVVKVANLLNIGAWPNQTVTVVTGGGPGGTPTYIQAPGMPAGYYVQA